MIREHVCAELKNLLQSLDTKSKSPPIDPWLGIWDAAASGDCSKWKGARKIKGHGGGTMGGDGGEKEWGFDAGENVKKTAAAATAVEVTAAVAPELEEAVEEPRSEEEAA